MTTNTNGSGGNEAGMTRREAVAIAGAALVVCGVAGCESMEKKKEKPPLITTGVVNLGAATDYPAGTANTKFVDVYGVVVVNSSGDPAVIRPKCTHMGCIAKWEEASHEFVCPCHGSRYDLVGHVTKGPAKRPLPAVLAQRQADETLTVDLTKLYAL